MKKRDRKRISVYVRDLWDNSKLHDYFEHKRYKKYIKETGSKMNFYNYKFLKEKEINGIY